MIEYLEGKMGGRGKAQGWKKERKAKKGRKKKMLISNSHNCISSPN